MSRYIHQLVGYGTGAVAFLTLGMAVDREAAALPFVSQVHAIPTPASTHVFDQSTRGGNMVEKDRFCSTHTRLLLRSELSVANLKAHYAAHKIDGTHGGGKLMPWVRPVGQVRDLRADWKRHQDDPTVFVVDFFAPGTPGTESVCKL